MQEIHFASIIICETERLRFGGASGSGGGSEVVLVDPPVLSHLLLLFKRDTGYTRNIGPNELEQQKK